MFSRDFTGKRLLLGEQGLLLLLLFFFVLFGGLVELRSALLTRRMGDLDCYLRGAWAVRSGADLYAVTDNNGWHYNYPPLLAIALMPLADPPGAAEAGMVPYSVSVVVWYVFSLLCLVVGIHWLACALEERRQTKPAVTVGDRRWWALRIIPIVVCLVPIGHTLMRGQVNMLVLLMFCGMIAGFLRGQGFRAGLFLAGTVCIKLYPAFLCIYPLWRRDWRCLGGCALGLFLGLIAIPAAVFGPAKTLAIYQSYTEVLIRPALGAGGDDSRSKELTHVVATDSQSLQAAIHNTLYPNRYTRPRQPASWVLLAHWLIGAVLTGLTLLAGGGRNRVVGVHTVLALGALILVMLLLSPVCHLHYFVFALPLVMGFMSHEMDSRSQLGWGLILIFTVNLLASVLPNLPGWELWRDVGLAMYGALLYWLVAIIRLRKSAPLQQIEQAPRLAA